MLVNIHDAKTHFSKLVNQALSGDDVIISRAGKPLVRLVPYTAEAELRRGGQFRGIITMADDFDEPLPDDILKLFYGDEN